MNTNKSTVGVKDSKSFCRAILSYDHKKDAGLTEINDSEDTEAVNVNRLTDKNVLITATK